MFFELLSELSSLSPLHHQHNSQRFPCLHTNEYIFSFVDGLLVPDLMRSKFVDQVVHVDEQEVDVFNLLLPPGRLRTLDQDVNEVQEVDQDGMVQLPQLFLSINIFCRVEPFDTLRKSQ